jgi:hypothetical protein
MRVRRPRLPARVECTLMWCFVLSVALAAGPADLASLFAEWRGFQKPKIVDGVPDYTPAAMARQHKELQEYQARLASLDPRPWPVPQQVDYQIVRAEMNGLDFDHRVLKPWARNPDFYVTVFADETDQPAREGPHALGGIEIFRYGSRTSPLCWSRRAAISPAMRATCGSTEFAT